MNVTQISTALLSLSEEDLRTINSEVVALLKHKSAQKQFQAGQSFNLGDSVFFINSRNGQKITGKVEKINVKSMKIRTEQGIWNVSPSLVQKVA